MAGLDFLFIGATIFVLIIGGIAIHSMKQEKKTK
jgi:hypothetical protein